VLNSDLADNFKRMLTNLLAMIGVVTFQERQDRTISRRLFDFLGNGNAERYAIDCMAYLAGGPGCSGLSPDGHMGIVTSPPSCMEDFLLESACFWLWLGVFQNTKGWDS
jgi:hypothetical protein